MLGGNQQTGQGEQEHQPLGTGRGGSGWKHSGQAGPRLGRSHLVPRRASRGGGRDMYQVRHYLRKLKALVHTAFRCLESAFSADTQLT